MFSLGEGLCGEFSRRIKLARIGMDARVCSHDNIHIGVYADIISEGFIIGKMWIVVSDEVEAAVRVLARKKGDISKLFEESLRMLLKERGIEIEGAES